MADPKYITVDKSYTVKKGDNLYALAKKNNVSFNVLKAKNPHLKARKPPYGINPGDKLIIPHKELSKQQVGSTTQTCQICTVEEMKIQCKHSKGVFTVDLARHAQLNHGAHLLQVIAGSKKPDTLTIQLKGACKKGKPSKSALSKESEKDIRPNDKGYCPSVLVTGNGLQVDQPSIVKVNIHTSRTTPCNEDFVDFFKRVMVPNSYPEVYAVSARTCTLSPTHQILIHAFPEISWNGKVAVGYSHATHKDSNFNQNQGYKKLKVQGEWGLSGSIEVQYDDRTWSLGGEMTREGVHQKTNALSRQLFSRVQGFLNKVTPIFGEIKSDYGSVSIDWPKLELSGGLKNKESDNDYKVLTEGSVKVAFSPLFGANFKVDILNILIRVAGDAAGGFGAFLVKAKARAEKGIGKEGVASAKAKISAEFTIGGKIEGGVEWKTEDGGRKWSPSGEVKAIIPVGLKGTVEGEATVWIFKAGAGANIGAKTELSASLSAESTDKGPSIGGKLAFSGITVYYAYYYEIGAGATSSSTIKSKPKGSFKDERKGEFSKSFLVVEAAEWPEKAKRIELGKGEL